MQKSGAIGDGTSNRRRRFVFLPLDSITSYLRPGWRHAKGGRRPSPSYAKGDLVAEFSSIAHRPSSPTEKEIIEDGSIQLHRKRLYT